MSERGVLLGLGRFTIPLPNRLWWRLVTRDAERLRKSLDFMTDAHHRVRDFVVRKLPEYGTPLSPAVISEGTGLAEKRVVSVLEELESRLTFLVRNQSGAVFWAYPVTAEKTPHRVFFGTGERINAA